MQDSFVAITKTLPLRGTATGIKAKPQWLASSPPTSLVNRQSARGGGGLVGMRVGGGVRVGVYRVVEGMGITNFTMVVPTVQSSRAREDGVVGGRLEKTTELVRSAARSRIVSISS